MTDPAGQTLVKVNILNKEYGIRSDQEDKVRRIADYLNIQGSRFTDVPSGWNRHDIAVMVAFKAASDYFQAREDLEKLRGRIESMATSLSARIEASLIRSDSGPEIDNKKTDPACGS